MVSAITAGVTALVVGTLIATVSDAAHAADVAKAESTQNTAQLAATAQAQDAAELAAYRTRLQDALAKLDTAYGALKRRDSAYRDLVVKVDQNAAALATANQDLAGKLERAYAEVQQLTALVQQAQQAQQAEAAAAAAAGSVAAASGERERESEDDGD